MPLIAIAVSLLAIVAGMTLLSKTQKEGLGLFFKVISIFVIIVAFLNMFAVCAYTSMKMSCMHGMHQKKMNHMWKERDNEGMHSYMGGHCNERGMGMSEDGCMEHPMSCKGMMMNKWHEGMDGACEMKNMQCVKKMDKDSVVVKKK